MMRLFALLVVLIGAAVCDPSSSSSERKGKSYGFHSLKSNESEVLAITAIQSTSMPSVKTFIASSLEKSLRFGMLDGLFVQQTGVLPAEGELNLPNFGATIPWEDILSLVENNSSRRLVVMVRHAQAWENLNHEGNDKCNFTLNGEVISNFDSALSTDGSKQGQDLNDLLSSVSDNGNTWFERLGLTKATFYSSPLMRTMQSSELYFSGLTKEYFHVTEMMRAAIGHDACNYRHSIRTPTSKGQLPDPFNTGCILPDDSLESLFSSSEVNFDFTIRPQGGTGIGLISDSDMLWQKDMVDDSLVLRSRVFLAQLFEQPNPIVCVVTHGEMIDGMYKAAGVDSGYPKPFNSEVVPMVVELL
jgi:broad specificity phosphatase PhoE